VGRSKAGRPRANHPPDPTLSLPSTNDDVTEGKKPRDGGLTQGRRISKEMKDERHLIRAGWNAGPGLMQRPGEAGDGQGAGSRVGGQASRQCDGRAALPDARVRASKTER
jgi:hypothetical protein